MQSEKVVRPPQKTLVQRLIQRVRQGIENYGVLLGVMLVALALRLWDMDVPLNTDEAKWLSRGDEFLYSLLAGNWAETYISPHPGVATMWVSGLGMALNSWVSQMNPAWVGLDAPFAVGDFFDTRDFPVEMYRLPRLLHGIVTAACIGGIYALTRRLFGWAIALLSLILLLLEPFFLAYQRFLTTDALQANFSVLAVLLFMLWTRSQRSERRADERRSRGWLIGSGVCLGLAAGAKVITLFMVPGLLVLAFGLEQVYGSAPAANRDWKRRTQAVGLWGATALVTLFVSWPALWLDLGFTLDRMTEGLLEEAQRGFFFFKGELVHTLGLDFYPISLAYRLSPAVLLGALLGAIALAVPSWRRRSFYAADQVALWLVILSYVGILSLATTKIDRYLSPVIPLLTILAAMAWLGLLQTLSTGLQSRLSSATSAPLKSGAIILLGVGLAMAQAAVFLPHTPYYITYYNPLLGGSRSAEETLMVGQGEGLDQAARWLADEMRTISPEVDPGISTVYPSVFHGYWERSQPAQIHHLPMRPQDTKDPEFWQQTHRVVFYISQIQRQLPDSDFLNYFTTQPYLHEVQQDGVNYAKIYPGPRLFDHEVERIPYAADIVYGDRIQLLGYSLITTTGQDNEKPLLTFYWNVMERLPRRLRVVIELRDRQGNVAFRSRDQLLAGLFPPQKIAAPIQIRDAHVLNIAESLPAGKYDLYVGWRAKNAQDIFDTPKSSDDSEGWRSTMAYVGVIAL